MHGTGNAFEFVIFLLVYNLLNSHILPSTVPAAVTLSSISSPHTLFFNIFFFLDIFLTSVLWPKLRTIAGEDLFVYVLVEEVLSLGLTLLISHEEEQ